MEILAGGKALFHTGRNYTIPVDKKTNPDTVNKASLYTNGYDLLVNENYKRSDCVKLDAMSGSNIEENYKYVLIPAEIRYYDVSGDNISWTEDSSEGLKLTFERSYYDDDFTYNSFEKIQVDGKDVGKEYYTVEKGSAIVTLKPEFLEKLGVGSHTLTAFFKDKENGAEYKISSSFSIASNPSNKDEDEDEKVVVHQIPKTGVEDTSLANYNISLILTVLAFGALYAFKRTQQFKEIRKILD